MSILSSSMLMLSLQNCTFFFISVVRNRVAQNGGLILLNNGFIKVGRLRGLFVITLKLQRKTDEKTSLSTERQLAKKGAVIYRAQFS